MSKNQPTAAVELGKRRSAEDESVRLLQAEMLLNVSKTVAAFETLDEMFETLVDIITNEVGMGIVPDNPLARRFRDIAGIVNQRIAKRADTVVFMASGLPMVLKGTLDESV